MRYEMKGGVGVGRKPLQGKTAESVHGSVQNEGGQRSAILEISRRVKRERVLIRESRLSDHIQEITQNPQMQRVSSRKDMS